MEREEITYPLGNSDFLRVLTNSFKEFIEKGTSRSTAKLKPLHGAIARDLAEKLGRDYTVFSQGYGIGKETKIRGRYVNKAVDITVKKGERAVALSLIHIYHAPFTVSLVRIIGNRFEEY